LTSSPSQVEAVNERTRIRVHIDLHTVLLHVQVRLALGRYLRDMRTNQHGLSESDKVRSLSVSAYSISQGADKHARSGQLLHLRSIGKASRRPLGTARDNIISTSLNVYYLMHGLMLITIIIRHLT
jgi:hypothetical protein